MSAKKAKMNAVTVKRKTAMLKKMPRPESRAIKNPVVPSVAYSMVAVLMAVQITAKQREKINRFLVFIIICSRVS